MSGTKLKIASKILCAMVQEKRFPLFPPSFEGFTFPKKNMDSMANFAYELAESLVDAHEERERGELTWSLELPKIEGFYWCINNGLLIAEVSRDESGNLVAYLPGNPDPFDLDDMEAWNGPIPPVDLVDLRELRR